MPDTAHTSFEDAAAHLALQAGEIAWSNAKPEGRQLTVCVPCYRDDAAALLNAMATLDGAETTNILIYDDGSADPAMAERIKSGLDAFQGNGILVSADINCGRAQARNRLIALSKTDWILFLDADMQPDDGAFLTRYIDAIETTGGPALIAGGFSLLNAKPDSSTALHAAQSLKSECLDAATRNVEPGRYVFTSNILVHRQVLEEIGFDEGFTGWGWEDVDWGLRVADRFPVLHIDNTATHLGLDPTPVLLDKFSRSGANFARLVDRHPGAVQSMTLYRMARRARRLPARPLWRNLARMGAASSWLPVGLRLAFLKTYRALAYSEDLS